MSYDINFWRQERPLELTAQEIYERLSEGRYVDGLAELPLESIHAKLQQIFADFDPEEEYPQASFEEGMIEFSWTDQSLRCDIRHEVPAECTNRIIAVMADHGCPMYDPQVGRRYDAQNGTTLGSLPAFDEPSSGARQMLQEKNSEVLTEPPKKPVRQSGCGTMLLGILFTVTWVCALMVWLELR